MKFHWEVFLLEKFEKMTVDKEKVGGGGRCVLVGIQIDDSGRELLSWALNNVTREDDRVLAIHVTRTSGIEISTKIPST